MSERFEFRHTAAELAAWCGARVEGDPRSALTGVAALADAKEGDLSFLASDANLAQLEASGASAVFVPSGSTARIQEGRALLRVEHPYLAFVRVLDRLVEEAGEGPETYFDPARAVAEDARLAEGVVLGPGVRVGRGVEIGEGTVLMPGVVVYPRTRIGKGCVIHAGAVIGADGFGYVQETVDQEGGAGKTVRHRKIPHVGIVVIEDEVEVGANTCIDRAMLGETRIGRGTKIDNLVQVGHNAQLGEHCILCGNVAVGGSAKLGHHVVLGGGAGVADHVEIAPGAQVGGAGIVLSDIRRPGAGPYIGYPAAPMSEMRKAWAALLRLPELRDRLRELERKLKELEQDRPRG